LAVPAAGAGDMDNYSVSLIGLGGSGVSDSRIPLNLRRPVGRFDLIRSRNTNRMCEPGARLAFAPGRPGGQAGSSGIMSSGKTPRALLLARLPSERACSLRTAMIKLPWETGTREAVT
jgi:hypothetical protein